MTVYLAGSGQKLTRFLSILAKIRRGIPQLRCLFGRKFFTGLVLLVTVYCSDLIEGGRILNRLYMGYTEALAWGKIVAISVF